MARILAAALGCLAMLAGTTSAVAQLFDHLKVYHVDGGPRPRVVYFGDLQALQAEYAESGCRIGSRPVYFMVPVHKDNVFPAPPGGVTGQSLTQDYVCYRLRCAPGPNTTVADQFGTHVLTSLQPRLLCAPAVPVPSSTTTTTTSSTTSTTVCVPGSLGPCCPAGETVLTSGPGTATVDVAGGSYSFLIRAGIVTKIDVAPAGADCTHAVILPSGGFAMAPGNFDIPAVGACASVTPNGCIAGGTSGKGTLWDQASCCPDADVTLAGDSHDGVCDATAGPCSIGGTLGNPLGKVSAMTGGCTAPGAVHARLDVPLHLRVWADAVCSPQLSPGCCLAAAYDPPGDILLLEADFALALTTATVTGGFADLNSDACAGPPIGPATVTGSPAPHCCALGDMMTMAGLAVGFSGGYGDLLFRLTLPQTVTACNPWPGAATCTLDSCQR